MEFIGVSDFYTKLQPFLAQITAETPNLKNVIDAFLNINKGCSCRRNDRINYANNTYANVYGVLLDSEKALLKSMYNNETITFKNGDILVGEF